MSTQSLLMLVSEQLRSGPVFVQSLCLHDDVALALPAAPSSADPQTKSASIFSEEESGDEPLGQKIAPDSELVWALVDPLDERDPTPVADRILVPFPFSEEEFGPLYKFCLLYCKLLIIMICAVCSTRVIDKLVIS